MGAAADGLGVKLAILYILRQTPEGWRPVAVKSRDLCNINPKGLPPQAVIKEKRDAHPTSH